MIMKSIVIAATLLMTVNASYAGRPLLVDDANINEKGAGHVEAWFEKNGSDKSFTIAPAYAVANGLELSLSYNRDTPYTAAITSVGGKYQISKPQDKGCHSAVSLGLARTSGNHAVGINLIGTCSLGGPDIHVNLSAARDSATHTNARALGVALEKDVGLATLHIEAVAQQHAKPVFQVGARKEIIKNWQLDGTAGRQGGQNLFSLGTKYQF
jgi:hypothetical protein